MRLNSGLLLCALVGMACPSWAGELVLYAGSLAHQAIGGIASSDGARASFGALGRFRTGSFGELDVAAQSNGSWSQVALLRPLRVFGRGTVEDPQSDANLKVRLVPRWNSVSSVGVGYFTHTGQTREFNLPFLSSGALIASIHQLGYAIDERLGLRALLEVSLAGGKSESALLLGASFGISYGF